MDVYSYRGGEVQGECVDVSTEERHHGDGGGCGEVQRECGGADHHDQQGSRQKIWAGSILQKLQYLLIVVQNISLMLTKRTIARWKASKIFEVLIL
jgi:hypothetical protein